MVYAVQLVHLYVCLVVSGFPIFYSWHNNVCHLFQQDFESIGISFIILAVAVHEDELNTKCCISAN